MYLILLIVLQFHRENYEVIREELQQLVDVLALEATGGNYLGQVVALYVILRMAETLCATLCCITTLEVDLI